MPTGNNIEVGDFVTSDPRRFEREDVEIYAQIRLQGKMLADCIIKNISPDGMAIAFSREAGIPDEFEIVSDYFSAPIPVKRVWSGTGKAGVELFI